MFVHSDLSGRISPASVNGHLYYFKLTDGFSKFKHVYFLKNKSETFKYFMQFKTMVEKQTGRKIKRLVNDNGGEYVGNDFQQFLKKEGIVMDKTASYTPQQNPISECGNCTTTERAMCMLLDAKLPTSFWAEAVSTAVYLENRSPESSIEHNTPHSVWYRTEPDLSNLRIFGCAAYKLIPKQFRNSKFAPTSSKLIMLGYQELLHNYRLLDPKTGLVTYSHDVAFDKSDFTHSVLHFNKSNSPPDVLIEELIPPDIPSSSSSPSAIPQLASEPLPEPDLEEQSVSSDVDQSIPSVES